MGMYKAIARHYGLPVWAVVRAVQFAVDNGIVLSLQGEDFFSQFKIVA